MAEKYTVEHAWEIWNDGDGTKLEVRDDGDGLGLLAIRSIDEKGKMTQELLMSLQEAQLLINSIQEFLKYKDDNKVVF